MSLRVYKGGFAKGRLHTGPTPLSRHSSAKWWLRGPLSFARKKAPLGAPLFACSGGLRRPTLPPPWCPATLAPPACSFSLPFVLRICRGNVALANSRIPSARFRAWPAHAADAATARARGRAAGKHRWNVPGGGASFLGHISAVLTDIYYLPFLCGKTSKKKKRPLLGVVLRWHVTFLCQHFHMPTPINLPFYGLNHKYYNLNATIVRKLTL